MKRKSLWKSITYETAAPMLGQVMRSHRHGFEKFDILSVFLSVLCKDEDPRSSAAEHTALHCARVLCALKSNADIYKEETCELPDENIIIVGVELTRCVKRCFLITTQFSNRMRKFQGGDLRAPRREHPLCWRRTFLLRGSVVPAMFHR